MQNRKPLLFVVAAVTALVLAVWLLAPGTAEDPDQVDIREPRDAGPGQIRPASVKRLPGSEAPNQPTPSARSEGSPQEQPVDEAASDRPPPASPAEEGLFALADASGKSVVRCPLEDFPDGFQPLADDVVVDGTVTRMVTPNTDDGPGPFTVYTGDTPFMMITTGAFPGTIGSCAITPAGENFGMQVTPEVFEQLGEDIDDARLDTLDDADDDMHPAQVALDDPDLSDGARAWLHDQLDAVMSEGEAVLERPTTNAEVLEAMDGVVVDPDED